jgi:hypothetical protein
MDSKWYSFEEVWKWKRWYDLLTDGCPAQRAAELIEDEWKFIRPPKIELGYPFYYQLSDGSYRLYFAPDSKWFFEQKPYDKSPAELPWKVLAEAYYNGPKPVWYPKFT